MSNMYVLCMVNLKEMALREKTFTAMIDGVRESAVAAGIIDQKTFDKGIGDLYRTTDPDGVFCYTFCKAVAVKE